MNVGSRPWQILPSLPIPTVDEYLDIEELPIYPIEGIDPEEVRIQETGWDQLPMAIKRIAAAVALDLSINNLLGPFYTTEGQCVLTQHSEKCRASLRINGPCRKF